MKRFWKEVAVRRHEGAWQVALDGRGVKTQKGAPQTVPSPDLARALASEWDRQGEAVDPTAFPLRDLADYAIDVVSDHSEALAEKLLRYAETDTLLYRADPDEALYARQQDVWEPIVSEFERREGVELVRVSGIVHRPQPEDALAHLRDRLLALDPLALAGTEMLTSLSASLVIGLSVAEEDSDPAALWDAASLEEEWQADLWGRDEEAETRRSARKEQFLTAAHWVRLARDRPKA